MPSIRFSDDQRLQSISKSSSRENPKVENLNQTISIRPDYILVERPPGYEVVHSDQPTALMELSTACKEAGCRKVLVLGPRTKMNLSAFELLELGKEIARLDIKMAFAEQHDASDDAVSLLESAALNRGGAIRFFDNERDAKDWLEAL